ncbi:hypothetical protein [Myroides sp. N17-2]|uniref:hypothetical protein n=1 Tax=Myroides sp. N17-2 TaxID=2030799 RepID=UPI000EFCE91A|nr:hypothetical protein [Myroides sp. N17-2]
MSTLEYKEYNKSRNILLLTPYLIIWLIIGSIYFGGFHKLLRQLEYYHSNKYYWIPIGVIIVTLFVVLTRIFRRPCSITINTGNICIRQKSKADINISPSSIYSIKVNTPEINVLTLSNKEDEIVCFICVNAIKRPQLFILAEEIAQQADFQKEIAEKTIQGFHFQTIIYTKTTYER